MQAYANTVSYTRKQLCNNCQQSKHVMPQNLYFKVQTQNARNVYGFMLNKDVQKRNFTNLITVRHEFSIWF